MARKLRVEYAGALYHVMNRGDRREPIFVDDRYLGDEQFRKELLEQMSERMGEYHSASQRNECDEEKANRIVTGELGRLGWNQAELGRRKKGDVKKVGIARRVRSETTMTLKWIAERLQMGTWTHVANRLYHVKN